MSLMVTYCSGLGPSDNAERDVFSTYTPLPAFAWRGRDQVARPAVDTSGHTPGNGEVREGHALGSCAFPSPLQTSKAPAATTTVRICVRRVPDNVNVMRDIPGGPHASQLLDCPMTIGSPGWFPSSGYSRFLHFLCLCLLGATRFREFSWRANLVQAEVTLRHSNL
ncbi:hypothetical protein BD311DRAFT_127970 [Dichomitus squalens]|uniref:Uncharacterized protein n=1 Tax=Dichomitus squalens TaxID=114155 RepID=A0A4Q9M9S6_9APHY|nr:hypothetical protein BD311DRAFT_127970 [Dichomitus squalens]